MIPHKFPRSKSRKRIEKAFYLVSGAFVLLGGRVLWMQATPNASATALTDKTFTRAETLPARRGQILGADGTAMAVTIDEYTVAVNPRAYSAANKDKLAKLLAQTIGGDEEKYRAELNKTERANGDPNHYVRLARHVEEAQAQKLKVLMGPKKNETRKSRIQRKEFWANVRLEASPRRHYPMGKFAPQLVGFTTNSGVGVDGMEKAWEETLDGAPGARESLIDAQGRAVPGTVTTWKEPVDGETVVTTIDPKIQATADATMTRIFEKYKPNFCVAVVMKPNTGEIVAVSTAPGYDPNSRPGNMVDLATNRAFSFAYEPGSTWKIITAAAAVENVPNWQSKQFFINGATKAGKYTIHDWQWWSGRVKPEMKGLSEGIRDSSNVTMYEFAKLMPRHVLPDYARKFGVGEKIDLPGFNVARGVLAGSNSRNPERWSAAQYANYSFGQGMMITPLQLAQIGGVIANDGVMMKPMLVREIRDSRGKVLKTYKPETLRRVIQPETANEVTKMLRRVVYEGTARRYIFVPGYAAVGKTGSAQKAIGRSGYSAGKFISSFVGFLPQDKPKYVIAVMADEPHGSHWGSEVCGPAFTDIAQEAMLAMRLEEGADAPKPDANLMERPDPKKKPS